MASSNRHRLDWLVLSCLNATIPALLVWKTRSGETTPTVAVLSGLLCLIVMNVMVLMAIRKRNARTGQLTSKWIVRGSFGLGLLAALAMSAGVFAVQQRNDYLDLALSDVPLPRIEPERKRLVVELIRRRAANSRDYDGLIAEVGKNPMSPGLHTPESFANKEVIESTITQLTKYAEIDFQYFQKQQAAMAEFRQKMATVDPAYLQAWDAKRQQHEEAELSANDLEHQWLASAASLYGYAASHSKDISLRDGRLEFATDVIRLEFHDNQDKSRVLYQKWQDAVQGLIRDRQQKRADVGLP